MHPLAFVALLLIRLEAPAQNTDAAVDEHLAIMVEQVVAETGVSINVSRSESTALSISRVNGLRVTDPAAEKDVRKLQEAFGRHPYIYQNNGPYSASTSSCSGEKTTRKPDPAASAVTVSINPACFK